MCVRTEWRVEFDVLQDHRIWSDLPIYVQWEITVRSIWLASKDWQVRTFSVIIFRRLFASSDSEGYFWLASYTSVWIRIVIEWLSGKKAFACASSLNTRNFWNFKLSFPNLRGVSLVRMLNWSVVIPAVSVYQLDNKLLFIGLLTAVCGQQWHPAWGQRSFRWITLATSLISWQRCIASLDLVLQIGRTFLLMRQ